jgi:hypothetical protein
MQFIVMERNVGLLSGNLQRTTPIGLTGFDDLGRAPRSTGASATKLLSVCSMTSFTVSCLRITLRGKAYEDEERPKITRKSNLYRCTKRTSGSASINGSATGRSLKNSGFLHQKGSVRHEGNFRVRGSTASFQVFPVQSSWRNIWISNPTFVMAVFNSIT